MGEETGNPSPWRLFRVHPALGLEEMNGDWLLAPKPSELGVAWLALEPAEQMQREADLLAAIQHAATDPDSSWTLELETDGEDTGVRMDRWKAPALERELLDVVWKAARERDAAGPPASRGSELDRTLRAQVLVAWDRYAWKAFVAAMAFAALLGLHPWGDRSVGAVAVRLVAGIVVLLTLDVLVRRWFRRSQHERE